MGQPRRPQAEVETVQFAISDIDGAVIHDGEYLNLAACVEAALKQRGHLRRANLRECSLVGVDLYEADLQEACFKDADLSSATLAGCNLSQAILNAACLRGASLSRASLVGASACDADFAGAYLNNAQCNGLELFQGVFATCAPARRALRSDGHEFMLWNTTAGWRVYAGCHFFDIATARQYWQRSRPGTPLGYESLDILDMFEICIERVAMIAAGQITIVPDEDDPRSIDSGHS